MRALACRPRTIFNDKTLEDVDSAVHWRPRWRCPRFLGAPWQDDGELAAGRPHLPHQRAAGAGAAWLINQFVTSRRGAAPLRRDEITGKSACSRRCATTPTPRTRWGVTARNREQNFALNLLMDPESTS